MAKHLVIVESPAKAKTLNLYLGDNYLVKASMGHIRDLPPKKLGVDVEHDFAAEYLLIPERKKIVSELQKAAKQAESILLAADPDREGEAICWHLAQVLEKYNGSIHRATFHEITKSAVQKAFQNIREIDQNKIKAQQTRRILDRLVGYLISPLLWKKVGRGLSAGRVQSIALRLICEREKEIKSFIPEEYWTITASLEASSPPIFSAELSKIEGKKVKVQTGNRAASIVDELKRLPFLLKDIKIKKKTKSPPPPFITSSLQQEAFQLRRFPVKKTMALAQRLYEGLEIGDQGRIGLITYMRTDSVRISDEARTSAREYITGSYGNNYIPEKPRFFKNKKKAQDAHEAIRPTMFDLPPERVSSFLGKDDLSLYTMIWNRFIASQMSSALIEETEFDIRAGKYQFKTKGEVIKFDGFLKLYKKQTSKEKILPKAETGEALKLLNIDSKQKFTQPPPRYTEGTLVKELEARGIGRPSTYAPIIATIQGRVYVVKEKGKFIPTDLGLFVSDYLVQNFPDLMRFEFTARLEETLDLISEGRQDWVEYLQSYYVLLNGDLQKASKQESIKAKGIPAEETCPECGRQLVIKEGRFGRFKACSGYPECTYKESLVKKKVTLLDEKCPECGSQLVIRQGKYGPFIACSNYPKCKYIKKENKDTGIACPEDGCEGTIIRKKTRRGKIFYGCSNFPKCKFATWDEPIDRPCPICGKDFILKKHRINDNPVLYCSDESCSYREEEEK